MQRNCSIFLIDHNSHKIPLLSIILTHPFPQCIIKVIFSASDIEYEKRKKFCTYSIKSAIMKKTDIVFITYCIFIDKESREMMRRIFFIWLLIIVFLFSTVPVSAGDAGELRPASSQAVSQQKILTQKKSTKKKPSSKKKPVRKKPSKKKSPKVYWTPGGSTYHCSRNCPVLRRARVIRSSTKSKCPKRHACRFCY